jgi:hypothetical protein
VTDAEREEIERLTRNPKYPSSDRVRDRLRTNLKKKGLIRFDRKAWQWVVLTQESET